MDDYGRELAHSRFQAIKGLSLDRFLRQLDFIQAPTTLIIVVDLLGAICSIPSDLPRNAILLTFDHGDADLFWNVFPPLDARGIQGCFLPPARALPEHTVLDVNQIPFILTSIADADRLLGQSIAA